MIVLRTVQFEGTRNRIQDAVRDAGKVSPLQAGVVLDAHTRQAGHFFAPQSRYTAPAAIGFDACLLRGNSRAA